MGAPTNYYVDPSIAGDSGSGTIGDPYGDLQYAFDQITRDAANGDQINVKSGTDEVLSSTLDLLSYGSPDNSAPLILRGYTSAANDGGIGGIDGNGNLITGSGTSNVFFKDMHLHTGSATGILRGNTLVFESCEIDNSAGYGVLVEGAYGRILGCYIHNCGSYGVDVEGEGITILGSYFANGVNTFSSAIYANHYDAQVERNILTLGGGSNGIQIGSRRNVLKLNSILSASGTGKGITSDGDHKELIVLSNLVEGFSGVGGIGIELSSGDVWFYGHNAVYNNATNYSVSADVFDNLGDNETLSASPFATHPIQSSRASAIEMKCVNQSPIAREESRKRTVMKVVASPQLDDCSAATIV